MVFTPMELIEKLAALVPAPRVNLVRYHGVLAPRSAWRAAVVPAVRESGSASAAKCCSAEDATPSSTEPAPARQFSSTWDSPLEPRRLPGRRRTRNPPRMACSRSTRTSSIPEVNHQTEAGGKPPWETYACSQ